MTNFLKVKNKFLKNILTLVSGTSFAQILPVAVSPILTRIYSPEEFGEFGLFIALLGILSVIACLKYEMAIALPENNKIAINVLIISVITATTFSLIILLIVSYINIFSNITRNFSITEEMLWLLPFSILVTGIYQALTNWAIRNKEFKNIATTQIQKSTFTVVGQVGFGLGNSSSFYLMLSHFIGQSVGVIRLLEKSKREIKNYKSFITKKNLLIQMKRYKNFPLFYSSSSLLNTMSVQLPLFILAFFFNPTIVGYYTLANRVLAAPISIVGTAIAQPYLQTATEKLRLNTLDHFSLKIFEILLQLGLVPIVLISIISPQLFSFVFGEEWVTAGKYVQLISVWLLFVFISSPLSHIFTVLELQKESLYFNVALFLTRLIVLIIGGYSGNDMFTIGLFGITGACIWLFQILWLLNKTGITYKTPIKYIIKETLIGLPYFLILSFTIIFNSNFLISFSVMGILIMCFSVLRINKFKANRQKLGIN